MEQPTQSKRCSRCQRDRPIDEFCKDRQRRDGLSVRCRECRATAQREYVARHRDQHRSYQAEWREENRERVNEAARRWRSENREAHLESKRQWRERNPEHSREYYEANKEAAFDRVYRRKALQRGVTIGPIDLSALPCESCGLCGEPIDSSLRYPDPLSRSVDHIVPLSRGGTHEQSNLQWTHLVCNIRKGAQAP